MKRRKRKVVKVEVLLSVAPHITAAEARREVRSRVNNLAGWYCHLDDADVRVRKIKGVR